MAIADTLDDATRSRLANMKRQADQSAAKKNIYAMFDKHQTMCLIGIATCAEEMLRLCQEAGMGSWTLRDCVCRSVMRNVDADEQGLVTAVKLRRR
jgi:hypothetical protein